MADVVKAGETVLPEVTGCIPSPQEISNAERDSQGNMHKDTIAWKWKITVNFGVLTAAQTSSILKAVKKNKCTVTFLNPETAKEDTIECYLGTSVNFPLLCADPAGGFMTKDGTIDLIEF